MATARGSAWLLAGLLGLPLTLPAAAGAGDRVIPITAAQFAGVLAGHQGQVVVVNFWATWCRPCLKEIPDLAALAERYRAQGLRLVPVALDDPGDLQTVVVPFLGKYFPQFQTYARLTPDMDGIVSVVDPAWNEILPTSYLLDRRGRVSLRLQGGKPAAEFEAAIVPLLVTPGTVDGK